MKLIPDQIQQELIDYLNGFDAYDFQVLFPDFMKEVYGKDELDYVDVDLYTVEADLFSEFERWVNNYVISGHFDWQTEFGALVPPYLIFSEAHPLPRNSWLVHRTRSLFDAFDQGATIERLALTTWFKEPIRAKCPANVSDQIGFGEVVFGFAHDYDRSTLWRSQQGSRSAYGPHAVIFQCDYAVEAYHSGDGEQQVIFPICTEYNLIQLHGASGWWTPVASLHGEEFPGEVPEFSDAKEAVDWVIALGQDAVRYGFLAPSRLQLLTDELPRANRSPL